MHNVLDDDDLPSKVDVAHLAQHGCAITKAVPEIDRAWNYDEATTFLSKLFPTPMQYASQERRGGGRRSSAHSPWVLLSKIARRDKLEVVPVTRPDGGDLYTYKGPAKSGASSSHIYIGSCSPQIW